MELRNATEQDLPKIVEIYNAAIPTRRSTADMEPITVDSRLDWFRKHSPERRPLLVHEREEGILAWMSFEDFYGRPAYRHTAELSIYVAPEYQGNSLGRTLIQTAEELAPKLGIRTLIGYVFAHNFPSLRLLKGAGFEEWGRLPGIAEMDGREYSLCVMGRRLADNQAPNKSVQRSAEPGA